MGINPDRASLWSISGSFGHRFQVILTHYGSAHLDSKSERFLECRFKSALLCLFCFRTVHIMSYFLKEFRANATHYLPAACNGSLYDIRCTLFCYVLFLRVVRISLRSCSAISGTFYNSPGITPGGRTFNRHTRQSVFVMFRFFSLIWFEFIYSKKVAKVQTQ